MKGGIPTVMDTMNKALLWHPYYSLEKKNNVHVLYKPQYFIPSEGNLMEDPMYVWISHQLMNTRSYDENRL